MKTVWYIATKDMRQLLSDKAGAFFAFGWPIMIAVMFGVIIKVGYGSGDWSMDVAVVDEDGTAASQAFVQELDDSKELTVTRATRQEATDNVRRGNWTAYIVLQPGFGETREGFFSGAGSRLEVGIDPARQAEAGLLQSVLLKHMFESYTRMFTEPSYMREQMAKARSLVDKAENIAPPAKAALGQFFTAAEAAADYIPKDWNAGGATGSWQPFEIAQTDVVRAPQGPHPVSSFEVTFPQGIAWGFISCSAVFGIGLVVERTKGTLRRLQAAPLGRAQILGGKALACFLTTSLVAAVILAIGVVFCRVRANSYLSLGLAVVSTSACFVGMMMCVSVLGRTEQSANAFAWPIFMLMALAGGGMVPLAFMPDWLKAASTFSPVKWGVLAMEGAIWREFTLAEMLKPCGILVAIGVVFFLLGVRLFPWTYEG